MEKFSDLEEALIASALSMLEIEENIEEAEENSITMSLWIEDLDGKDTLMRQIIIVKDSPTDYSVYDMDDEETQEVDLVFEGGFANMIQYLSSINNVLLGVYASHFEQATFEMLNKIRKGEMVSPKESEDGGMMS
jgi:hypothetical protein